MATILKYISQNGHSQSIIIKEEFQVPNAGAAIPVTNPIPPKLFIPLQGTWKSSTWNCK
jgi:hypothetical protein